MSIAKPSYEGRTIYRVTEFDLLSIPKSENKIYACTDSRRLYEDISNVERKVLDVSQIDTEIDREYNFRPTNGVYYYVWETNELWLYHYGWELIIGDRSDLEKNQYVYSSGGLGYVNKGGCCESDKNGILGDGSVVVRDSNRLIKGKLYIDETDNDLIISSFLGGGIKILPSGSADENGSLIIEDGVLNYQGDSWFNGSLRTTNDMTVVKDSGQYKVYTEEDFTVGEWEFDGNDVIRKLNVLPQPLDLNVKKLQGYVPDDFAKAVHTHVASDITDLEKFVRNSRHRALTSGLQNKGITVSYDKDKDEFTFVPDTFIVSLNGGVSGFGTVRNLNDVTITTTVDPLKHHHSYKELTDISEIINKFDNYVLNSKTATIATPNRLLYLDGSGNLPADITGNSATATKWQTKRLLKLINGVSGQVFIDGTADATIDVTVDPAKHEHEQYFLKKNVGVVVPSLENGKINRSFLYDEIAYAVNYAGTFNPANGFPSTNGLLKGAYYVASSNGIISGVPYISGDIVIYNGSTWNVIHSSGLVQSVNNQTGNVTINADSINAITNDKLYDPANPSAGKIITTVYDKASGNYYPNIESRPVTETQYAQYLTNPIKIKFVGNYVTSDVIDIVAAKPEEGFTANELQVIVNNSEHAKKSDFLSNPIKIKFAGDLSSEVIDLNLSDTTSINQLAVKVVSSSGGGTSIDDGVIS